MKVFQRANSTAEQGNLLSGVLGSFAIGDLEASCASLHTPWTTQTEANWSAIYVVRRGLCWLTDESQDGPVQLQPGVTVLLPRGTSHCLSDSTASCRSQVNQSLWNEAVAQSSTINTPSYTGGITSSVLACRFRNPIGGISAVLSALPGRIQVPASDGEPAEELTHAIGLLEREILHPQPGSSHIVKHLIQVLVTQVMRHLLTESAPMAACATTPFGDPLIGAALVLIHTRLKSAWTVASLAAAVGVSRSTFAAHFANIMGMTPLRYLWQLRMEQAAGMLRQDELGVKEIATRVGYDSESAFSNAFKRWSGMAPGTFRRQS